MEAKVIKLIPKKSSKFSITKPLQLEISFSELKELSRRRMEEKIIKEIIENGKIF